MVLHVAAGCALLVCLQTPAGDRLVEAAQRGDIASVRRLLDAGVHPDAKDRRGRVALHAALDSGPWVVRSSGEPGLARPRVLAVARLLLEQGSDPNRDVRGRTPLMVASGVGFIELAELLLKCGADPNTSDARGAPALGLAASPEMVRLLLRHGASLQRLGASALLCATKRQRSGTLSALIAADPDAASHGRQALVWSVSNGYIESAQHLLQAGVAPNTCTVSGEPLIALAVQDGHIAMAAELLRAGADIQARDGLARTPLHRAAGLPERGKTAGAVASVRWLLGRGASVTARDEQGRTPLFWSILNPPVVELLATRASVNLRDNHGQTALYVAAQVGRARSVRILLARGADPNTADAFRTSPLHAAVLGCAQFMQQKLSPAFPNKARWRREHEQEYIETIRLLLRHGGRRQARSSEGLTPLDIARKYRYRAAIRLLTEATGRD
jgi:ankyrin repeat protein